MLKEIQLMNKLKHPNILKFEAVCVHEGQLHALTEFIEGGTLETLVQDKDIALSWVLRMELGLDISQGLAYLNKQGMFHRDLTSKNIFIRKKGPRMIAIIGDFGLAAKIPNPSDPRLPQVGSPYWMSPECLRGERYGRQADIFSFGIILCELIARLDADPDVLPRTSNFGVEYKAFSLLCPNCPPDFLKLAFTCVSIDPSSRPTSDNLVPQLSLLIERQRVVEKEIQIKTQFGPRSLNFENGGSDNISMRRVALKRFMSEGEVLSKGIKSYPDNDNQFKKSPSDKARIHQRLSADHTAKMVGEEMCLLDPYYQPPPNGNSCLLNPFATLPRLREGRKIVGSSSELFSSCFELPSPRVASPTDSPPPSGATKSLPNSPPNLHRKVAQNIKNIETFLQPSSSTPRRENLKMNGRFYSSRGCLSQDDSSIGSWSGRSPPSFPIRRCGSCESGFYSVSNEDWMFEGAMSNRSIGSSLLTVSDLEEDLRMASVFLTNKRTSSVFTDSLDDLSSRLDDISSTRIPISYCETKKPEKYEKDIRDIVEYFEKNCHINRRVPLKSGANSGDTRTSPEIARSQKIESLIKKVAENKSRARYVARARQPTLQQHLQVCDGIVRSKLPLFDQSKRQTRGRLPFDQQGFVKARLAMFDKPQPKPSRKLVSDFLVRQRELRNLRTTDNQLQPKVSKLTSELQKPRSVEESANGGPSKQYFSHHSNN